MGRFTVGLNCSRFYLDKLNHYQYERMENNLLYTKVQVLNCYRNKSTETINVLLIEYFLLNFKLLQPLIFGSQEGF